MVLYLSVIFAVVAITSLVNILVGTASWYVVIFVTVGATAFQFAIDGLFAFIVNKLPSKWFDKSKKCFFVSKKSQNFYEKLKIRKWKDKVWELGGLGGFRKNKLAQPDSPEYIERFIVESNKGIVTHRIAYFVGFLALVVFPLKFALKICLPVAVTNLILNILPVMVLRYNIPKLFVVHKRLTRTKHNKKHQEDNWWLFFFFAL